MKSNDSSLAKPATKKKSRSLKKAPQAPKRFKSSYILFFIHVQEKIKKSLPVGQASAPQVSKRASEMWKTLSAEDRLHWDNEAAKEKQRYLAEKEVYTGPWQVPQRRAKKDPTAPKRNPSAFLLFSLTKRKELKGKNPDLKNTEISRILGELWRNTRAEEKRPFVEREQKERESYKERMSAWRIKKAKDDAIKKQQENERTEKVLAERAQQQVVTEQAEKVFSTCSDIPVTQNDTTFKAVQVTNQSMRSEDFPQYGSYHQISPINHCSSDYSDQYQYGHQASWPAPEANNNHQNQMSAPYRSPQFHHQMSVPEKYCNSFDAFHSQQDLGFSEHNSFYEQSHQRPIKLEGGADSPYSYSEEFDPVPIN